MKYVPYILFSVLIISGALTWFSVYSSLSAQDGQEQHPDTSMEVEAEKEVELEHAEAVLVEEVHSPSLQAPYDVKDGITEQMVSDWNFANDRVSIDQLLSLIKEYEKND